MDTVFKDDCMFVNSKLRWDQRISIIFASGKEKERVKESDKNDNNDDFKDIDKINERDEEVEKDKRERDKSLDAVSIKLLRESTGLLVTLSKVRTLQ
jgi:hypothetical protein